MQKKAGLKEVRQSEKYQKDVNYAKEVDKFEEDNKLSLSYHNKLLFLISQHYKDKDQKQTSEGGLTQPKNPTVLPWTLAIIFGIMTVVLLGLTGFLFYKQRKIKRFKV